MNDQFLQFCIGSALSLAVDAHMISAARAAAWLNTIENLDQCHGVDCNRKSNGESKSSKKLQAIQKLAVEHNEINVNESVLIDADLKKCQSHDYRSIMKRGIEVFQYCLMHDEKLQTGGHNERRLGDYLKTLFQNDHCVAHWERAWNDGMKMTWKGDKSYPISLIDIDAPPGILFYKGNFSELSKEQNGRITVVGTRRPSDYGRMAANEIGRFLAHNNIVVISGMAFGIDSITQCACLAAGGRSIAVLASGADWVYPAEHRNLYEQLLQVGAVVSEHAPGVRPKRYFFPARNRIMSGLGQLLVVIEASQRSGTLTTVNFALNQGRDVWSVPGTIFSPESKGTNKLISDGANVLYDLTEFGDYLYREKIASHQKQISVGKKYGEANIAKASLDIKGQRRGPSLADDVTLNSPRDVLKESDVVNSIKKKSRVGLRIRQLKLKGEIPDNALMKFSKFGRKHSVHSERKRIQMKSFSYISQNNHVTHAEFKSSCSDFDESGKFLQFLSRGDRTIDEITEHFSISAAEAFRLIAQLAKEGGIVHAGGRYSLLRPIEFYMTR